MYVYLLWYWNPGSADVDMKGVFSTEEKAMVRKDALMVEDALELGASNVVSDDYWITEAEIDKT